MLQGIGTEINVRSARGRCTATAGSDTGRSLVRILHLVNSLAKGSRITNVVVDLAVTQVEHGDHVTMASPHQLYAEFLLERAVQFNDIATSWRGVRYRSWVSFRAFSEP